MRTTRLYVDAPLASGHSLDLPDDAAHHLLRVLRARVGAPLLLFNGDGAEYHAELTHADKHRATVTCGSATGRITEAALPVTLVQALAKGERMDYAIQKATELGVAVIQPMTCERVDVRLSGERLARKQAHWQRVAIAAAEQSGRCVVPRVTKPVTWPTTPPAGVTALVMDPTAEQRLGDLPAPHAVHLAVGPEGGFSDGELARASAAGWARVRFGPRILRTETAGPALLAAMLSRWGDL